MKYLFPAIFIVAGAGLVYGVIHDSDSKYLTRKYRMDRAEKDYLAGCQLASLHICSKFSEPTVLSCYKEQLEECPKAALNFRLFLENGRPSK